MFNSVAEQDITLAHDLSPIPITSTNSDTPYGFVVSLLDFEKRLIASVASPSEGESVVPQGFNSTLLDAVAILLFDRWQRKIATKNELENLVEDMSELSAESNDLGFATFSNPHRLSGYRSFFSSLGKPYQLNQIYSRAAERKNIRFKEAMLSVPDLIKFLRSMRLEIDKDDWSSWRLLAKMFIKFPEEMQCWTSEESSKVSLVEHWDGFQIWNVVRLFTIHLTRPQSGPILLRMWQERQDLATKLWSQYQEVQARQTQNLQKVLKAAVATQSQGSQDPGFSFPEDFRDEPSPSQVVPSI